MLALTRDISPAIAQCELTHLSRVPIDVARAKAQHAAYEEGDLPGLDLAEIDRSEPCAANVLRLGETLLMPSAFPRTRERLERLGLHPRVVDADDLAKAEVAVTRCSLILRAGLQFC